MSEWYRSVKFSIGPPMSTEGKPFAFDKAEPSSNKVFFVFDPETNVTLLLTEAQARELAERYPELAKTMTDNLRLASS